MKLTSKIKVVTDSACDLPQNIVESNQISIVPLTVRFGDDEYVDRVELDQAKFWDLMKTAGQLPSTAAPSPGAFEKEFRQAAADGAEGVVCVTISSRLSATYQAAVVAAQAASDAIEVRVIDSEVCTVGEGLLAIEAAELGAAGDNLDTIVQKIEDMKSRLHIYGALDTLDNLRKGGRIGAAGAFFGSLLSIKPIIRISEGEVKPESRQRTRSRALGALAQYVLDGAPVDRVAVSHSNAPDVESFVDLLTPVVKRDDVLISDIGPVIGTHGGPGVIAVAFVQSKVSK